MDIVKQDFMEKVETLEEKMVESGGLVGHDCDKEMLPLRHNFIDGVYIREIFMRAGTLITSKIHKTRHVFFVMKGECSVLTEKGTQRIKAPYMGVTEPGTKRVLAIHSDCNWLTIHPNKDNCEDLDEIEKRIIANDMQECISNADKNKKLLRDGILGIYAIVNKTNNKFYIGSSKNINNRWNNHRCLLNGNKHPNKYLQNSWNKYGETNFYFEIIEKVETEDLLIEKEQKWFSITSPKYNLSKTASRTIGIKKSEDFKINLSKRMIGNKYAKGNKGKKRPQYVKDRITSKLIGTKHTDERKRNISKSKIGKKASQIAISNMRKSQSERRTKECKSIGQYSTNGELIKIWDNTKMASNILGFCGKGIRSACTGRYKTFKGFIWRDIEGGSF